MSRSRPRARLVLYGDGGRRLERELDAAPLEELLARALAAGGAAAEAAWARSGILTTRNLLSCWPEFLATPSSAFLRSGRRFRTGLALQVEAPGHDLDEYWDDLLAFLEGREPVARFDTAPAEPLETPVPGPPPAFDLQVERSAPPEPLPQAAEEEAVEVLPPVEPGAAVESRESEAVFGLAGEQDDRGVEEAGIILAEDLPWLNPGDRIVSVARGRCRLVRVEDAARQVVVEDLQGNQKVLHMDELLDEFRFDERPWPVRSRQGRR